MRASELCVRNVITAWESESVVDAARRMAMFHVSDLIVVEERCHGMPRPIGIVTDRDLVVRVLAHPDRSPETTAIADVMRRDLVTASEADEVESVVAKMRDHALRRIPIVDLGGGLQGLLAIDDVLGWMRERMHDAARLLERECDGPMLHIPR